MRRRKSGRKSGRNRGRKRGRKQTKRRISTLLMSSEKTWGWKDPRGLRNVVIFKRHEGIGNQSVGWKGCLKD